MLENEFSSFKGSLPIFKKNLSNDSLNTQQYTVGKGQVTTPTEGLVQVSISLGFLLVYLEENFHAITSYNKWK
jgi:hypothetical protein